MAIEKKVQPARRKYRPNPFLKDGSRRWTLLGPDGEPYASPRPGTLGGHRRTRIYGRLDCPGALRAIDRGGYVADRVFFLNERHARTAGYRPCAVCLPEKYREFKSKERSAKAAPRR